MGLLHVLVKKKKKIAATTITVAAGHQVFPKENRFVEAEQRVNNKAGTDGLT